MIIFTLYTNILFSAFLLPAFVARLVSMIWSAQSIIQFEGFDWNSHFSSRSRASARGKDSEYENLESDGPDDEERGVPLSLNTSRDSEQREIDEFEEEERRLLAEEEKVSQFFWKIFVCYFILEFF